MKVERLATILKFFRRLVPPFLLFVPLLPPSFSDSTYFVPIRPFLPAFSFLLDFGPKTTSKPQVIQYPLCHALVLPGATVYLLKLYAMQREQRHLDHKDLKQQNHIVP